MLLYDGVCGLCNRAVQFTLPRDGRDRLRYAAAQSDFGRRILERHGKRPDSLETFYLVENVGFPEERLWERARAAVGVAHMLGGPWGLLARLAPLLPWRLLDGAYDAIARRRYRWFGRYDACPLPEPKWSHRFLRDAPPPPP